MVSANIKQVQPNSKNKNRPVYLVLFFAKAVIHHILIAVSLWRFI
ncbi:hypothetical protein MuYL_3332 [Mucilaginibacter xinganensis]|uniref:Uncharacterized protein n=1 Tax=Mucilaginibacter xinganensis TaxID=1234841 RepID=A0A223NZB1_9SPHI|nr:hypothetical protein MuYL_3332 [Mucilaginibacter xinganensis]